MKNESGYERVCRFFFKSHRPSPGWGKKRLKLNVPLILKKGADYLTSEDERPPCASSVKREHVVRGQRGWDQPTVFDSDAATKVERFIYAAASNPLRTGGVTGS